MIVDKLLSIVWKHNILLILQIIWPMVHIIHCAQLLRMYSTLIIVHDLFLNYLTMV